MRLSEPAVGSIPMFTCPETGRSLVALSELQALVPEIDPAEVLEGLLRAGAEVKMIGIEDSGDVREQVVVRMPEGWERVARGSSR